jgi:hypothetical protein
VDDLGIKCTMLHVPRHTRVTLKQYVDRHFSKKSVMDEGGPFSKFTKDEQNSIKRGEVSVGMSRDAVLMAYGYPPEHKTPSLKLNMWTYWRDRFRRTFVTFKDDKVSRTTGNPMAVYRDDPGAMVPADSAAPEAASTGEGHYTRANIWWEDPKNIPSTNYHRGMIIPAGSKVKDLRYGAGKVSFTVEDLGVKFTIEHEERHSRITTKQLVDRYFSKDNVMAKDGPFHKFTKREQENIKNGTIAIGMCKDAVLMAYGYPPSHKTPSLESNIWTYWRNRFRMIMVVFNKDGRVSNVTQ